MAYFYTEQYKYYLKSHQMNMQKYKNDVARIKIKKIIFSSLSINKFVMIENW